MDTRWEESTSNILDDIETARKAIRANSGCIPKLVELNGIEYTHKEFRELLDSVCSEKNDNG